MLGVILFAGAMTLTSTVWARQAEVVKTNGQTIKGELVKKTDEQVILQDASGIKIIIPSTDIKSFKLLETIDEYYNKASAALKPDDKEGRYKLAYEMNEKKAYHLAEKELTSLAVKFPTDKRISLLLKLVRFQKEKGAAKVPGKAPAKATKKVPGKAPATLANVDREVISQEGINRVSVYEYNFAIQPRPVVKVPREVLDEFLEEFKGEAYTDVEGNNKTVPKNRAETARFLGLRGNKSWQQLDAIMAFSRSGTRKYYGKIEVASDPPAMRGFRNIVNRRYVAGYFRQHFGNGVAVKGLYLFAGNSTQEVYSNFYILHKFEDASGNRLIDRSNPEQSLLLQWGLPRSKATYPAPDIKGWRSSFRDTNNKQFRDMASWIRTLYKPKPNYEIEYQLPPKPVAKKKGGAPKKPGGDK